MESILIVKSDSVSEAAPRLAVIPLPACRTVPANVLPFTLPPVIGKPNPVAVVVALPVGASVTPSALSAALTSEAGVSVVDARADHDVASVILVLTVPTFSPAWKRLVPISLVDRPGALRAERRGDVARGRPSAVRCWR